MRLPDIIRLARDKGCIIERHGLTGNVIIDGMEASYWTRLHNKETTDNSKRIPRKVL